MAEKVYKHLQFAPLAMKPEAKTRAWLVLSAQSGVRLGHVQWHTHWRRYILIPAASTVWDQNCLWDVADFCARMTTEQQEDAKRRREDKRCSN